jgi:hypothetical protein
MDESIMENAGTETANTNNTQETSSKTYTQEEFDRHMAGMKNSLAKKYERQYAELGDPEELRALKADAEKRKTEEQIKRGEFESTLQEMAAKKDAEISKRDNIIKEYRVNTPILDAAARYNAIAPEQVKSLLSSRVRLNETGDVEVVSDDGNVRYDDSGKPVGVDVLVREFLDSNPHFRLPTPATTNTKSNTNAPRGNSVKLEDLDMANPEHRAIYREFRKKQGVPR